MNTLYIIGNGFDLAHDLKTSYNNFIIWYLKRRLEDRRSDGAEKSDCIVTIKGRYFQSSKNSFETISQIYDSIDGFNIKIVPEGEFMKRIIHKAAKYNWVDIETEYFLSLLEIKKFHQRNSNDEIIRLNRQLEIIRSKLEEYLNQLDKSIEHKKDIQLHFFKGRRDSTNKRMVLNFNYTSIVEEYVQEAPNSHIIHIHGKLNDPQNPIIFGYGDEMHKEYSEIESLDNDEYLKNFKSFSYLKNSNYSIFDDFINSGKFNVKILGHSCGLSDRVLLSTIFQHINCTEIEICYHKESELINDHFEKTIRISRHFSSKLKETMRVRIMPFDKSKPLTWDNK